MHNPSTEQKESRPPSCPSGSREHGDGECKKETNYGPVSEADKAANKAMETSFKHSVQSDEEWWMKYAEGNYVGLSFIPAIISHATSIGYQQGVREAMTEFSKTLTECQRDGLDWDATNDSIYSSLQQLIK